MGKGRKTCPQCNSENNGPRSLVCKDCGHVFSFKMNTSQTQREKRTQKVITDFDWRDLKKGDMIKVGGGPFYTHNGEVIPMGYKGKFVVDKVDDKGICAWGIDKCTGFAHIYMGEDYFNTETGIKKVKHRILKIKRRPVDETAKTQQLV